MPVERPETKLLEHTQVVADHQRRLGMSRLMLTVGQWLHPAHVDSLQQTMVERNKLSHPTDTEIEMEISFKLLFCFPGVTIVENHHTVLVNVRPGLIDHRRQRHKL